MFMQTTYMVILGVTCMLAAGCIPVPIPGKIETSPEVYGRVVEAGSEQPIAGAKVTFKDLHGTRRSETTTQTNGTFQIGPEWHSYWVVVFTACPVYYIPKRPPHAWFLEIAHAEYVTREIDMRYDYPMSNNVLRIGDATLDPIRPRREKHRAN